jgi:hypothetical protein
MELLKTLAGPFATVIAALVAAIVGTLLARRFSAKRDAQDRESQWRSHAVELTKLDLQRKLAVRDGTDARPRPSILDFLANYRDLQELGTKTPKDLYLEIEKNRISSSESPARDA